MGKGKKRETPNEKRERIIHTACVRVCSSSKKSPAALYVRKLLEDLVDSGSIPLQVLEEIPRLPGAVQKTRFDQIYDAVMFLAYPEYPEDVRQAILGPEDPDPSIRVWRVILPREFGLYNVMLRAPTYPLAFARACDYVTRRHVRERRTVPQDLHFQVKYVTESELRRHFKIRRVNKRRASKVRGDEQEFSLTDRQLYGVRRAALGPPDSPDHRVIHYIEKRDNEKLSQSRDGRKVLRVSSVELETYRSSRHVLADVRLVDLDPQDPEK